MKHAHAWATAAVALLLPLAACDDGPSGTETASVSVYLTDAPGDVLQAWVTVDEIRLVGEGAEEEEEGESSQIIDIGETSWTGNLLELQDGIVELVGGETVPAGTYSQLRLIISQACVEVETETGSMIYTSDMDYEECGLTEGAGDLQMPSWGASGLKVQIPASETEFEGTVEVLLDFLVEDSFGHATGQPDKWVMSPVIHVSRMDGTGT